MLKARMKHTSLRDTGKELYVIGMIILKWMLRGTDCNGVK
jgi:hypothetical protein